MVRMSLLAARYSTRLVFRGRHRTCPFRSLVADVQPLPNQMQLDRQWLLKVQPRLLMEQQSKPEPHPQQELPLKQETSEEKSAEDSSSKPEPNRNEPPNLLHSITQITPEDLLDLCTLLLRHVVWQVTLQVVSYKLPLAWNWQEFQRGATKAIHTVHSRLGVQNYDGLEGLLADSLLEQLRDECPARLAKENWSKAPVLRKVQVLGIYSAKLIGDETGGSIVQVKPLIRVTEEYSYYRDTAVWQIRRMQKWTLEWQLSKEGIESGWQVADVGRRWYWRRTNPM